MMSTRRPWLLRFNAHARQIPLLTAKLLRLDSLVMIAITMNETAKKAVNPEQAGSPSGATPATTPDANTLPTSPDWGPPHANSAETTPAPGCNMDLLISRHKCTPN